MTEIGTARVRVRFNGAEVKARLREAAKLAIDYTMARCVWRAREDHAYMNRTGFMEASVSVWDFAGVVGPDLISGKWGAHANYALFLEIGTSRPDSGAPRAAVRAAEGYGDMWEIPPPQPFGMHTDTRWTSVAGVQVKIPGEGPLMDPRMSLRPAATIEYAQLGYRIKAALYGEELV